MPPLTGLRKKWASITINMASLTLLQIRIKVKTLNNEEFSTAEVAEASAKESRGSASRRPLRRPLLPLRLEKRH